MKFHLVYYNRQMSLKHVFGRSSFFTYKLFKEDY